MAVGITNHHRPSLISMMFTKARISSFGNRIIFARQTTVRRWRVPTGQRSRLTGAGAVPKSDDPATESFVTVSASDRLERLIDLMDCCLFGDQ